jgi:hypothetical protein
MFLASRFADYGKSYHLVDRLPLRDGVIMLTINRDDIEAVYPRVARRLPKHWRATPARSGWKAACSPNSRRRHEFNVRFPGIIEHARKTFPKEEFDHQGVFTEAGLTRLREYLNEVAPENFHPQMNLDDVPTCLRSRRCAR